MSSVYFITHPEVLIDPAVPIHEWRLSPRGRERMQGLLARPGVAKLGAVWCSTERKAIDGADVIANAIGTTPSQLSELGENDRSATGYLPKAEFEATADAFFANPQISIRGWETAVDAQRRIVAAITRVVSETPGGLNIAVVSHGGVGALLLCHLKGCPIRRTEDQPGDGGGNYYCFDRSLFTLRHGWRPIEDFSA
jgi:broad specificity phosphatase PhoE